MPPMGPFLDNILWLGIAAAILVFCLKTYARRLDHSHGLDRAGPSMLSSINGVFGLRDWNRGRPFADTLDPTGKDLFDRWSRIELQRIEDERRRLDSRHRDLSDLVARLRTPAATAEKPADAGSDPHPTEGGAAAA